MDPRAPSTPLSALDATPPVRSSLDRAVATARAASSVGFDWPSPEPVFDAVRAELAELDEAHRAGDPTAVHHELGDVLLAVCNLARHLGVPPTAALDAANARFARRFRTLEAAVHADGLRVGQLPLPELEERWQAAKRVLAKQGEGA